MTREELLWTIVCGLAGTGVCILGFMSVQLWNLNEKIATVLANMGYHEETIEDHELRIRALERGEWQ